MNITELFSIPISDRASREYRRLVEKEYPYAVEDINRCYIAHSWQYVTPWHDDQYVYKAIIVAICKASLEYEMARTGRDRAIVLLQKGMEVEDKIYEIRSSVTSELEKAMRGIK